MQKTPLILAALVVGVGLTDYGLAAEPLQLKAKTGLAPFVYTNSPAALPNYVAGAKWGTQAEPIRTMQLPLSPEESQKHLVMPEGFEAKLFVAEPHVAKPIAMAWDERGRLWVAETIDYPNELKPPGEGRDRIKICEDTDGDGRADKFTVFADKLSIPTGMVFANGGLIVIHSGETVLLRDTDGDGQADTRQVLFSGWGMGDTHATASNLRMGFDNWIWGTVGYSGFDGTVGGKHHKFGMGVYRFKADGSVMEFVRSSNNNTWGLGFSEEGTVFGSTANNNASWYMAIPNRFYEAVSDRSASRMETIADTQFIYPATEKVRQVDQHGRYTAGAGHALYTARSFPRNYWNRLAFVTEPTGHLIGFYELAAKGADFTAINRGSFLASDDEWTAPIMAEVGPDGAVWVIDWYNYIVQHNPVPIGFKNGKGNAYETPLRDKRHGRIYRVSYTAGKPTVQPPPLNKATPDQLVATLRNDNLLWRSHAQRLLVERGKKDVVPALLELVRDTKVDELGLNPGAIHALWTLHGLGALDGVDANAISVVNRALKHPSAAVRRTAVSVSPRSEATARQIVSTKLLRDADAQVRLAALLALAEVPPAPQVASALHAALQDDRNTQDKWLRHAAISAAARNDAAFLKLALADHGYAGEKDYGEVLRVVAGNYAHRAPGDVAPLLKSLKGSSEVKSTAFLDGLTAGWPQPPADGLGATVRPVLSGLMPGVPVGSRDRLLALAKRWGVADVYGDQIPAITKNLRERLANGALADDARVSAARSLIGLDDQAATAGTVLDQITLQSPPALANGLIASLGESRDAGTGREILNRWKKLTPTQRRGGLALLNRRAEWAGALLDAVEKNEIPRGDLGPEHWQQLRQNRDQGVAARARALGAQTTTVSADREEIVKKLLPVAKLKGDPARGKEVFLASCAVCHMVSGQGAKIGPDLTGMGAKPKEEILVDILDPNRSVEANYRLWTVTTKGGDSFSGRLDAETQTSIEILDLTSQLHKVQRKDIANLEAANSSIMPTGFEAIPEADLAALLAFLGQAAH